MLNFKISLSQGDTFNINEHQSQTLQYIINKYVLPKIPNIIIKAALVDGSKIDMNKTLYENNISQDSHIILVADIDPQKNDSLANNLFQNNNNYNTGQINLYPLMNPNYCLEKCMQFIVNGLRVPIQMLDYRGNCLQNWRTNSKSGPPGYLKNYFPPIGWFGIGLKVFNLYDNGNNNWLKCSNERGEWYIAYHPIKSVESITGILNNGFRKGPYQGCKNFTNVNPLTNSMYPLCGEGAYFIPNASKLTMFSKSFCYLGGQFKIAFMCRINPYKVRIANLFLEESWIVNGDILNDPYGRKRDDEVRPYRILVLIEK